MLRSIVSDSMTLYFLEEASLKSAYLWCTVAENFASENIDVLIPQENCASDCTS